MKGLAISDAGAIGPTDIGNMAQHGSNMFHEKKIQIRTCGCKDQMWFASDGFKISKVIEELLTQSSTTIRSSGSRTPKNQPQLRGIFQILQVLGFELMTKNQKPQRSSQPTFHWSGLTNNQEDMAGQKMVQNEFWPTSIRLEIPRMSDQKWGKVQFGTQNCCPNQRRFGLSKTSQKKNNSSDLSCSAHTLLFQCICSFSDTQEKHENQRAKTQTSRLPRCSSALFSKEILVQWGHSLQLCRLVSKPRTQNKSELYCSGWWYTYPSEKYESQGEPNHQPVFIKPICFSRPTLPKMTKSVDPPYWIASLYVEQTQGDFQRCAQIAGGPSSNTILFAIPTHT